MFLPKMALVIDINRACKAFKEDDRAVDFFNSSCYEWLNKKNSYDLIQTGEFRKLMREEDCCKPLTTALYEALFASSSFVFNSSIKIDSLFNATAIEIAKLPTIKLTEENACRTITIPNSLFSLFNKIEQDSLRSIIAKDKFLSVTDSLLEVYEGGYRYDIFPPIDVIACSIRASIEPEPSGEHALLLNSTRYRMVKLSNNHYVLRKGK
jgi:hypothetical protein